MFTVKATDSKGHTVKGCESYRYNIYDCGVPVSIDAADIDTVELFDGDERLIATLPILGTLYVMNANGKTVDTFYARPTGPRGTLIKEGVARI